MYKPDDLSRQRLLALRRYISDMEQGDVEMVAAVLHMAEQDRILEQMILELNDVYQEIDRNTVSEQEGTDKRSLCEESGVTWHSGSAALFTVFSTNARF